MSLRTKLLTHALPLIPTHSFTPLALTHALSALPTSHPDHQAESLSDTVLDTLFGSDVAAKKALVGAWEEEGLREMRSFEIDGAPGGAGPSTTQRGGGQVMLREMMGRRLEYSARVGEHLVEAYALLSSPTSSASLPLPSKTLAFLSSMTPKIPPLYSPPSSSPSATSSVDSISFNPINRASSTTTDPSQSPELSSLLDSTTSRLALLRINPLGPLSYAWRISDEAMHAVESRADEKAKKGMMNEPVGAGPEWYTRRIGLSLAYLSAESHLLQPYPQTDHDPNTYPPDTAASLNCNPHLPRALRALDRNLSRYESIIQAVESGEQSIGGLVGYAGFIGRSWAGIIRSRGW